VKREVLHVLLQERTKIGEGFQTVPSRPCGKGRLEVKAKVMQSGLLEKLSIWAQFLCLKYCITTKL